MPNELIFSKSKEVSTDSPLGTVSVRRYRQIRVLAMCSPLSPSSAVIQLAFEPGTWRYTRLPGQLPAGSGRFSSTII